MFKNIFKTLTLFALFFMLTAQQGCQTTGEKKLSSKEQVKQNMILEIKTKIEQLGGTPLTGDEAKYKGDLGKDKYIQALEKQLAELKAKDEKEKADAKAKEKKYHNNRRFSFSYNFNSRLFHLQTNGHSDEQSSS